VIPNLMNPIIILLCYEIDCVLLSNKKWYWIIDLYIILINLISGLFNFLSIDVIDDLCFIKCLNPRNQIVNIKFIYAFLFTRKLYYHSRHMDIFSLISVHPRIVILDHTSIRRNDLIITHSVQNGRIITNNGSFRNDLMMDE
jgi:hypothetical protein